MFNKKLYNKHIYIYNKNQTSQVVFFVVFYMYTRLFQNQIFRPVNLLKIWSVYCPFSFQTCNSIKDLNIDWICTLLDIDNSFPMGLSLVTLTLAAMQSGYTILNCCLIICLYISVLCLCSYLLMQEPNLFTSWNLTRVLF